MNFKTTLTLLILLAAAGLAAWLLKPKPDADPWARPVARLTESKRKTLLETLGTDSHRLTGIRFAPAGKPALELAREGDGWRMLAPANLRVKTAQVEGFLLAPLNQTHVIEQKGAAQAGGSGFITLTFGGRTLRLDLGPDAGAGLAQLSAGGKTYQVENDLHQLLAHLPPLVAFINPALDTPPAVRATGLTLKSANGTLALLRRKNGDWVVNRPGFPRASGEAVTDYCAALAGAKISELPQETANPALFGLNRPVFEIRLDEAGAATRLEVGAQADFLTPEERKQGEKDHTFIRLTRPEGPPLIAVVESAAIAPLIQGETFFRDTRVVRMKQAEARRVQADGFDLTQDADGRVRFTDAKTPFALDAALGKAAFDAPFRLKPAQLGPKITQPAHTFKVTDVFGREETLWLAPAGEDFAAAHPGEADSFILPKAQVAPLLAAAGDLRDREIKWLSEGGGITAMTLEQKFCGLKFEFVKKDGMWAEAKGQAFETAAVEALEKAVERPRMAGYLADNLRADLSMDMALSATAKEETITIGVDSKGMGVLDMPNGKVVRGEIASNLTRLLQSEFRPHQLLALAPAQITGIELNTRVKVTRRPDGVFDAAGAKLTQAACAALFDTLGNLRSEQPAGACNEDAGDTRVILHTADDKQHLLRIHGNVAAFSNRFFVWDPASPQAKAVQAVLDRMK